MDATDTLPVALAQISPVWLDRDATLAKVCRVAERAAADGARLCAFGEALVPGYPFWVEHTDGARFEAPLQKELFAHYLQQGVDLAGGDLGPLQAVAARHTMTIVLGCMERAADRGGHSLYCSLVTIAADGALLPAHRKLVPTHEERLVWAPGDGHGLRCHRVGSFTVGGLSCWENWMPLARAALHAQGEDLHVATWPGNVRNTADATRFLAREGRSFVLSVCGVLRRDEVPDHVPHAATLRAALPAVPADGGSCIAGPDGEWIVAPSAGGEQVVHARLDHALVRRERHNFDVAGHYARPDVLRVVLDDRRQSSLERRRLDGGTADRAN